MKIALPCLLLICLLVAGCSKEHDRVAPVPDTTTTPSVPKPGVTKATGSLSGKAAPAGILRIITAKSLDGKTFEIDADLNTGEFTFDKLPEGTYTVAFSTSPYYYETVSTAVLVAAGKNTDAGTLIAREKTFALSCKVNGAYQGWNWQGHYSSSGLFQVASYSYGTVDGHHDYEIKYRLSISIDNLTAPGSYTCNANAGAGISYVGVRNGSPVSWQGTNIGSSTGTIIITKIDRTARTIKGTFTAKLAPAPSSSVARDITDGIIDTTY